ncbi:hypothetical protein AB0I72_19650 [Nocardiopsis sp. NPDC049922]|uniref:hypothetical protein n=1 Tax=Nocardiopsis sp. NPDC049922 TaxID=3155157 RepID=UPI0033F63CE7
MPSEFNGTRAQGDLRPQRIYRPTPEDPTLSIIIDDGHRPPPEGYWLYTTPTGYLFRFWDRATFGRVVRGGKRHVTGEPYDLCLKVYGLWSWDQIPDDGSGFWGSGEEYVNYQAIRCLEVAGLLVPYPYTDHA